MGISDGEIYHDRVMIRTNIKSNFTVMDYNVRRDQDMINRNPKREKPYGPGGLDMQVGSKNRSEESTSDNETSFIIIEIKTLSSYGFVRREHLFQLLNTCG